MSKIGLEILKILGVPFSDHGDGWLTIPCLFAKHTHGGGVDNAPSARFNPEGVGYKCYTCHESHGKPTTLLYCLFSQNAEAGYNNVKVAAAIKFLGTQELPDLEDTAEQPIPPAPPAFVRYPKSFLDPFPSALKHHESLTYLISRSVPKQAIVDFDIRFDQNARRVVFPYFLDKTKCAGAEGRLAFERHPDFRAQNQAPRYTSYRWNGKTNKGRVWFRQSELKLRKPLIVVEGPFDAIKCYCHYRNVTAMLGSFPSKAKIAFLAKFTHVFWIADNDQAGQTAKGKILQELPPTKISFIDIPKKYGDVGEMPSAEVRMLLLPYLDLDPPILTKKEQLAAMEVCHE